jgi:hypothetical protein
MTTRLPSRDAADAAQWMRALTDENSGAGLEHFGTAMLLMRWMKWTDCSECEPSRGLMARCAGVDPKTITRRTTELERDGWLRIQHRGRRGGGKTSVYTPTIPAAFVPQKELRRTPRPIAADPQPQREPETASPIETPPVARPALEVVPAPASAAPVARGDRIAEIVAFAASSERSLDRDEARDEVFNRFTPVTVEEMEAGRDAYRAALSCRLAAAEPVSVDINALGDEALAG